MAATWLCVMLAVCPAFAQDFPTTTPDNPATEVSDVTDPAALESAHASGLNLLRIVAPPGKRLFGVLPNYKADQFQPDYKPITAREKYKIAEKDSFDWPNFLFLASYAVQSQVAANGFSHSGGVTEFGRYYARGIGDQVIGNYLTEAVLPSLLHEDPRFFRIGYGSFRSRATHAAMSVLVTRKDDGRYRFYVSEIVGNAGVVALTSLYYPENRAPSEMLDRYGMQLGNDVISNLLTEFWPDLKRHLPFHAK